MSAFRRFSKIILALAVGVGLITGCTSEVRIGALISETGAVASNGATVKKGLDLALDEINAAGGWRGGKVVLLYRDDATMPDIGERAAARWRMRLRVSGRPSTTRARCAHPTSSASTKRPVSHARNRARSVVSVLRSHGA